MLYRQYWIRWVLTGEGRGTILYTESESVVQAPLVKVGSGKTVILQGRGEGRYWIVRTSQLCTMKCKCQSV